MFLCRIRLWDTAIRCSHILILLQTNLIYTSLKLVSLYLSHVEQPCGFVWRSSLRSNAETTPSMDLSCMIFRRVECILRCAVRPMPAGESELKHIIRWHMLNWNQKFEMLDHIVRSKSLGFEATVFVGHLLLIFRRIYCSMKPTLENCLATCLNTFAYSLCTLVVEVFRHDRLMRNISKPLFDALGVIVGFLSLAPHMISIRFGCQGAFRHSFTVSNLSK